MKEAKIVAIVFMTLLIVTIIGLMYSDMKGNSYGFYEMEGTAIEKHYHEEGDYTSMVFETEDGNKWEVDGTVCPLNAKVNIAFHNKGTPEKEDDEIVKIESIIYENGR